MVSETTIDEVPRRSGLGIVLRSMHLAPPDGFLQQTRMVAGMKRVTFRQVFFVILQFQSYQYYISVNISEEVRAGKKIDTPFSIVRFELGTRTELSIAQLENVEMIASDTINLNGVSFPGAMLISIEGKFIELDLTYGTGVSVNAWFQGNYYIPCIASDNEFNEGMGAILCNSAFDDKKWTELSIGTEYPSIAQAMLRQPRITIRKRQVAYILIVLYMTVRILLYLCLFTACLLVCIRR